MEILRFKKNEFNMESFIHYYNENIEELLFNYPHYISRVCLVDRDYMDVIVFDEDYEDINNTKDYVDLLHDGEYALHFVIGKTYEGAEKVELLHGEKYILNHYTDDIYEDDNTIKDIGDLSLNVDNLVGLLFDLEENEVVVYPVDFEHGGEISNPRIRKVDYCGDMEDKIVKILDEFLIQ
ncbi:hypothetical protein [Terrisporobacter mayombei]|uniref:Uncharacterized protein n=1 Tax=Terrisporobacter mayombei TaxID=1541 RepID=A0ABY9PYM9_9FIRM|nr:hypothetical protein [Terrisporobacter mayombei]MCC3868605.1 hypothetical protein [Terrisporobacter mayombei]WMT80762.1 hypothetical protein TEMA_10840 [Terrisporobacter mayombei]